MIKNFIAEILRRNILEASLREFKIESRYQVVVVAISGQLVA